ncbi:MAG: hypothetical protein WED34_02995 [Planctomycetales bacterium]
MVSHRQAVTAPVAAAAVLAMLLCPASARAQLESVAPAAGSPAAAQPAESEKPRPPAFAVRPYRVRVSVAFDRAPALTPEFREGAIERLSGVIERTFGPAWQTEIVEDAALFPASAAGLERLAADSLVPDPDGQPFDKRFVLVVERAGGGLRVSGREWDASTRLLGGARSQECPDRRTLPEAAGRLLAELFQPQLVVEKIDEDRIALALRAGAFALPDSEGIALRPGEFLVPYLRYFDKENVVRRIQFLPFTYLAVDEVHGARVSATVVSGLRAPLGTGRRRQVELAAIVLRPHLASTRVKLVPRTNPERPLVAHRVALMKKRLVRDEPLAAPVEVLSDRRGEVLIPLDPEYPLRWVYVWSGQALLARFPIVPGATPTATAELPDDSVRLALEGRLEMLEAELVDAVALRAVQLSRMRQLGREGKWKEYDQLSAALEQLPKQSYFESQLNIVRQNALAAARASNNRVLESRVTRQSARLQGLIGRYLSLDPVRALREEMQELRKIDRAAAAKPPAT